MFDPNNLVCTIPHSSTSARLMRQAIAVQAPPIELDELHRSRETLMQLDRVLQSGTLDPQTAHDLANFLSIIKAYASLVQEMAAEGLALDRDDLTAIRVASRRAFGVANAVVGSSNGVAPLVIFDVTANVQAILPLLRATLPSRIELISDVEPNLVMFGLPVHLDRILINLVLNARDAISAQGSIRLSARRGVYRDGAPAVHIQVADNGSGMSLETLSRIGTPNFTTKPYGNGLGLSSTKALIGAMGGVLRVDSFLGKGTTFTALFPWQS